MRDINHIKDLTPDPSNARTHNPRNIGMIQDSLQEVGAARSIVIDEDGVILAGNGVVDAAGQAGIEKVQVVDADGETLIAVRRTNLTPDMKTRLALWDNRTQEASTWNPDVLARLRAENEKILDGLFDNKELKSLLSQAQNATARDVDPHVDKADELQAKWQVQHGQVFAIPSRVSLGLTHYLLCGDATDSHVLATVLNGKTADLVFTDPPYNVAIVGGDHNPLGRTYESGSKIANDQMSDADFDTFLHKAFQAMHDTMRLGAVFYVCAPARRTETQFRNAIDDIFTLRQCIVWVKQQFVFGRQDYHWRHESILYGWKDGAAHYFTNDHTQDTVWEIDRPMRSDKEHPSVKPIELVSKAIRNSSQMGDIVLDPFVGSGTTLVACEQLARIGYGVELDPKYCAVTLERLVECGMEPHLVV